MTKSSSFMIGSSLLLIYLLLSVALATSAATAAPHLNTCPSTGAWKDKCYTLLALQNWTTGATSYKVVKGNSHEHHLPWKPTYDPVALSIFNESWTDQGWDYVYLESIKSEKIVDRRAREEKVAQENGDLLSRSDAAAYYSVGFLEGYLTYAKLAEFSWTYPLGSTHPRLARWMHDHFEFLLNNSCVHNTSTLSTSSSHDCSKPKLSPFWARVRGLLEQVKGLSAGYTMRREEIAVQNATAAAGLPEIDFYKMFLINFGGEIGSVIQALEVPPMPLDNEDDNTIPAWAAHNFLGKSVRAQEQHCSGFIKVSQDDLFMAHDTWADFSMIYFKQYKTYAMDTIVSFSGYAGRIASGDDWYTTSRNLAIQETTNMQFNKTLSALYTVPQTVSEFLRVMAANYNAFSGPDWVSNFSAYNSGTYCNQYMTVDFSKFSPSSSKTSFSQTHEQGEPYHHQEEARATTLQDGLLWISEQLPGSVTAADMTSTLRKDSYWASYNIPYFTSVYNLSMYPVKLEEEGTYWSYNKYARARLFKRLSPGIKSLADMKTLMRYNNYLYDEESLIPESSCKYAAGGKCSPPWSPMLSIASRGDLVPYGTKENYGAVVNWIKQGNLGALDTKIASWKMITQSSGRQAAAVISGPTNNVSGGFTPFKWSLTNFSSAKPSGSPDEYNFDWIVYELP